MTKRFVNMTLPMIGYIEASVELDIPDNITDEDEARKWILTNYNTETISQLDDFVTSKVDWSIEDDNHGDLCIMYVDFDEELVA
jgi:hypothetical protein